MYRFKYVLIMCLSMVLMACNAIPKKNTEKNEIDVYIFADEDINRNLLNDPSPVKVNLLQLKTEVEFNQMNELSPDGTYKKHLGESVIDDLSMMIRPKSHLEFKLPKKEEAPYLGIVAAYRDLNNKWKLSFYKQDKRWYQIGGEYLYLDIKADGIHQITQKEAIEKILNAKLEKEGKDLAEMTEKEKEKWRKKIEKIMEKKKAANLEKGIYIPTEVIQ
ncbi:MULTISPECIES: type VI secretion system lipoprotein TssJ [Acinetobacter]|uniref:Type VI secretion system lipoprotein TssJ n=1 Tax=Acinetobacter piscicola TaxID=2006115 RepID=A0A7S7AIR8_9GAMM|nr:MULTISPECIES: type VI secretion system lipoprotein TssJ [Acinetobacter]QOW47026.1 type VI secretion system lipoprotein TssJ [Acinetobacter piscicola]